MAWAVPAGLRPPARAGDAPPSPVTAAGLGGRSQQLTAGRAARGSRPAERHRLDQQARPVGRRPADRWSELLTVKGSGLEACKVVNKERARLHVAGVVDRPGADDVHHAAPAHHQGGGAVGRPQQTALRNRASFCSRGISVAYRAGPAAGPRRPGRSGWRPRGHRRGWLGPCGPHGPRAATIAAAGVVSDRAVRMLPPSFGPGFRHARGMPPAC
jgi:hypothetical protein